MFTSLFDTVSRLTRWYTVYYFYQFLSWKSGYVKVTPIKRHPVKRKNYPEARKKSFSCFSLLLFQLSTIPTIPAVSLSSMSVPCLCRNKLHCIRHPSGLRPLVKLLSKDPFCLSGRPENLRCHAVSK